ncbi:MAG: hypothetical protein U0L22_02025 [Bacteroidales bacterium]|nr:hypothetical protein [Bacteroidales bacterium]
MKGYEFVNCKDFYPHKLKCLFNGVDFNKKSKFIVQNILSLDTETSKTEDGEEAWLYQWMFSYPAQYTNKQLVYGRKPSQLADALGNIKNINRLGEQKSIVIYIHNASFDFNYFFDFLEEHFGEKVQILAVDNHSIISFSITGIEFRCSYKLSMKSLAQWGNDMHITHKKLVGTIDYETVRYQDSPLYKKDWKYLAYDVISLDECIEAQLNYYKDDIRTVPLTNTGYVRRFTRNKFKENPNNRKLFKQKALTLETYTMCKKEFAGGYTHGSRFYSAQTVRGTIRHRDFASHYPTQQICTYAPGSSFRLYHSANVYEDQLNIDDLPKNKCLLISLIIDNVRIKEGITMPYLQASKYKENKLDKVNTVEDNGRILYAKGRSLIVVNEIDLALLVEQYKFDYTIYKVYEANKEQFPEFLRDVVKHFFYEKSKWKKETKRIAKEKGKNCPEYREADLNMMIAKGMLNSIYGMSATDVVRTCFYIDDEYKWTHDELTPDEVAEKLEKYYESRNSFMNYELGCWTTAQARKQLFDFIKLIGYENVLYCDTDSAFYISTPEIEARIEAENEKLRKQCDENEWYITLDDKRIYFNQFEDEEEDIYAFRFLHAKCYAYEKHVRFSDKKDADKFAKNSKGKI